MKRRRERDRHSEEKSLPCFFRFDFFLAELWVEILRYLDPLYLFEVCTIVCGIFSLDSLIHRVDELGM